MPLSPVILHQAEPSRFDTSRTPWSPIGPFGGARPSIEMGKGCGSSKSTFPGTTDGRRGSEGSLANRLHSTRVRAFQRREKTVRVRGKAKDRLEDAKVTDWLWQRTRV